MKALVTAFGTALLMTSSAHAITASEILRNPEIYAGVGFGSFTGDLGDFTGGGVAWAGRVGINPWDFLGAELNYQGLHTSVGPVLSFGGVPFPGNGQPMVHQEITVDAKGSFPLRIADRPFKPYALVGLGYAHISSSTFLTNAGLESSNAFAVPFGAGVSYDVTKNFVIDGRFTYNVLTGSRSTIAPSGNEWNAGINVGARFGGE